MCIRFGNRWLSCRSSAHFRNHFSRVVVMLAMLTGFTCAGWAQYDFLPQVGIKTFATYQQSEIDSVDLTSGNVNLHIPLIGFPQKGGKLRLNFVVRYNEPQWLMIMGAVQGSQGGPYPYVSSGFWKLNLDQRNARPLGVTVSRDQGVSSYENDTDRVGYYLTDGTPTPYTVRTFGIRDKSGAEHIIGIDTGAVSPIYFQSPDSSGWRPIATYNGPASIVQDKDGLTYTSHSVAVSGGSLSAWDISDAHGHTIVTDANGWLDSMQRRIPGTWQGSGAGFYGDYPPLEQDPYPGGMTNDLSHCDSTAVLARQWIVPTSTDAGGSQSYYFCYSSYSGRTAFNFVGLVDGSIYLAADDQPTSAVLLSRIVLPNNTFYAFQYDPNFLELTRVDLPTGGSVSYEWSTKIWDNCSTSLPVKRMVTKRTVTSNNGTSVWTYKWNSVNCNAAPGDGPDVLISKPDGNDEWRHHYVANRIADSFHWIVDSYAGATNGDPANATGTLLKRVETFTSSRQSPLFQANPSSPSGTDADGNPIWHQDGSVHEYFPGPVEKTITTLYDKTSQQIQTSQETDTIPVASTGTLTYWNPDNFNNPQPIQCTPCTHYNDIATVRNYDVVQGSGAGPGALLRRTETSYRFQDPDGQAYANAGMTSLPSQVQVFDGTNTQVSQTKYTYDDAGYSSNITAGELTSTTKWINASSSLQSFNYYSPDGTWAGSKDAKGNLTTVTAFDCSGLFPSQVTSASGTSIAEAVTYAHDCNTGKVASYTDANGKTTSFTYADPLSRIKSVSYPDGGHVGINYTDGANSSVNILTDLGGTEGQMSQTVSYDLLGRTIGVQTSTPEGDTSVTTTYDAMGRVHSTSNPYTSNQGSSSDLTVNHYDELGRLDLRTNPDNTTQSWSYNGNVTTFKDENNNPWQRTTDGLGRLVSVAEPIGTTTTYGYDPLGNLISINQPGVSGESPRGTRSFVYDGLSRLTNSSNPETGNITYSYLNGGLLCSGDPSLPCSKTDARGISANYAYDALNRLIGRSYSGTSAASMAIAAKTLSSCYQYGATGTTVTNGVGRLIGEWTQSGANACPTGFISLPSPNAVSWKAITVYDEMGRIKTAQQCIFAPCTTPNTLSYTYDLAGNVTSSTNGLPPSTLPGVGITYDYDNAGRLKSVVSSWNDLNHPPKLFAADSGQMVPDCSGGTSIISPYGPLGLNLAQYGVSSNNAASLLETHCYDKRGRLLAKTVFGTGAGSTITQTQTKLKIIPQTFTTTNPATVTVHVDCGTACGNVNFTVDGALFGAIPLDQYGNISFSAGTAPPAIGVGPHTLKVDYVGDATHAPSTDSETYTVVDPTQFVTVTMSKSAFTLGENSTINVKVACGLACGQVQLTVDGTSWITLDLDNTGQASFDSWNWYWLNSNFVPGQPHALAAHYLGNSNFAPAVSSDYTFTLQNFGTQQVKPTLNLSKQSFTTTENSVITVQHSCNTDCGQVTLTIDGNYWVASELSSSGSFTVNSFWWNSSYFTPGQHTMVAHYLGNATYAPMDSDPQAFTIQNIGTTATTTTLTIPPSFNPANAAPVSISVSCSSACGMVQLTVDGNLWWNWPLDVNGNLNIDTLHWGSNWLTPGNHNIQAKFLGNGTYAQSSSAIQQVTVTQ